MSLPCSYHAGTQSRTDGTYRAAQLEALSDGHASVLLRLSLKRSGWISTRYTHLSQAGISRRHLCRHTSLLGVHLSLACISLENASYLYLTGVYFTGCAYQSCTSHRECATHGRVHLMGRASHRVCASHGHVHLIGVHLWACLFRGHAPQRPASYRRASHKTAS